MSSLILAPGDGEYIAGVAVTVKSTMAQGGYASSFEIVVPPGYDVGAHVHGRGQEVFFVLEGELDMLVFEPIDRGVSDWHQWTSRNGQTFMRGGPGAFMWVPENTPHAFANHSDEPVRMFSQSSVPGGHENYFRELGEHLMAGGPPDQGFIADLRRRYFIEQLTDLKPGRTTD